MTAATNKTVFAIVLAAGTATRFGATKQLAQVAGVPLVRQVVDVAAGSVGNRLAVVIGHDWEAVSTAIQPFDGFLILNDRYTDGIGSSLSLAVRTIRHVADAVIVVLADQPLISTAHLDALQTSWSGADNEIVVTAFDAVVGPPALFGKACFGELAALQGDTGARELLEDDRFAVKEVYCADAAIDIDEPADINRLPHNARS